ncbi:MAG: PAS domain-containing protein [Chloroflexales bacterium]|nr:PAS domain-containing protein [Chloroflexales bacterium]
MHDDMFAPELLEGLEGGAYCVDKTRRIVSWNRAAEHLTGYTAEEAVGTRCWHNLLRHVDDLGRQLCRGWCPLVATMQDGMPREARVYLHHHDGHRVPVQISARPVRAGDGAIIGAVETFRPVDEPEGAPIDDGPGYAEDHDHVVGMAGISAMHVRIDRWLEAMRRGGRAFGVVHMRIDAREQVGVAFDLETCEAIIKAVGATISHAIRAGDVAARIDDEQFLILLPDSGEQDVIAQAQRLRFLVEQTFLVKNRRLVRVHAIASNALGQPDDTVEDLLERAADAVISGQ